MLGIVSAHVPWIAITILEQRQSCKPLRNDFVTQSTTTPIKICCREYTLTVDAIKKQLASQNKVSLAWDGWTSTNKLAIMLVIAYYVDRSWAMREVQLAFDVVECLFFSCFES
jgi:hypothetical protein